MPLHFNYLQLKEERRDNKKLHKIGLVGFMLWPLVSLLCPVEFLSHSVR